MLNVKNINTYLCCHRKSEPFSYIFIETLRNIRIETSRYGLHFEREKLKMNLSKQER